MLGLYVGQDERIASGLAQLIIQLPRIHMIVWIGHCGKRHCVAPSYPEVAAVAHGRDMAGGTGENMHDIGDALKLHMDGYVEIAKRKMFRSVRPTGCLTIDVPVGYSIARLWGGGHVQIGIRRHGLVALRADFAAGAARKSYVNRLAREGCGYRQRKPNDNRQ